MYVCTPTTLCSTTDWRNGPNTRLLGKRLRVRFPHITSICVHEHVCLYSVCVFSMYSMYVFANKGISMYIYPLSRIHNTSLVSAYFGLDTRECECIEYYLYLLKSSITSNIYLLFDITLLQHLTQMT
jgi:hypothetical protein